MPRLFTGIELPDEIRRTLSRVQMPLPGTRWIEPENYHITLRFAGDIDNHVAGEFAGFLGQIDGHAFDLRLAGIGQFGGHDTRSLWVGLEPSSELDALARAHERAARNAGLEPEKRSFKPHVTLARVRNGDVVRIARFLERFGAFRSEPFTVRRFVLFSSRPKQGGGPYVVEAGYSLHDWSGGYDDE